MLMSYSISNGDDEIENDGVVYVWLIRLEAGEMTSSLRLE